MRISGTVFAAALAGAVGLGGGFAVTDGPTHLTSGNARPTMTRPGVTRLAGGQDAALAALLRPATATQGDPLFMFIDGINGESQDARHPMWSDLIGYHVSFSRGTGVAGRAALGSFVVTMPYSLAVPPLLRALVTGRLLPAVEIQAATKGDLARNYLTIRLGNVRVAAAGESSSGERPVESLSFAAARVSVSYTAQKPDGSPGPTETFCFDFTRQRAC